MSDPIDDANDVAMLLNDVAVHRQREAASKMARPYEPSEGVVECVECGSVVNTVRRKHGFELCWDCANYAEKSARRSRLLQAS